MRQEELSLTLKKSRESSGLIITMLFEDGSRHVIRPSAAFNGDVRGLVEYISEGRKYKLLRD